MTDLSLLLRLGRDRNYNRISLFRYLRENDFDITTEMRNFQFCFRIFTIFVIIIYAIIWSNIRV